MTYRDDYEAKIEIWAKESRVYPLPRMIGLPAFSPQKFSSYEEMNAWKKGYLERIAAAGGVRWMK
jgi:hypothetical protein